MACVQSADTRAAIAKRLKLVHAWQLWRTLISPRYDLFRHHDLLTLIETVNDG
jgi:hypothetical protein